MTTAQNQAIATSTSPTPARAATQRPDRLILVYDGDSGLGAMLLDVLKKAVGQEDCALCEITYGPLGKRSSWRACQARLGIVFEDLHRDQIPSAWAIARVDLPCVLARVGNELPWIFASRDEIIACRGSAWALEGKLLAALSPGGRGEQ